MGYTTVWNNVVSQYNKNLNCKEDIVQRTWEILFSTVFNYDDSEIDSQRSVKMGVETKRADIVIKNGNEDLFIVELKRHVLHEGREQLFSYLNQLKIDLGVLVCDKLYIYDYDFTVKDSPFNGLEINFVQDNPLGIKFVELFNKANFDKQRIRDFIEASNNNKNIENEIKQELSSELLSDLLNRYFSEKYPGTNVENILSKYNISITSKSKVSVPVNLIQKLAIPNLSFSKAAKCGTKDLTQYSINGIQIGGKGPTVYAAVNGYIESHPNISFAELQAAFPDYLAKPGFGKMVRRVEEVTPKEWNDSRFNKHPLLLTDGTQVVVSTQWKPDNMHNFIDGAKLLGIEIIPID